MDSSKKWIVELVALAASFPQIPELTPLVVGFDVNGARFGLDLLRGALTDGEAARCWLTASDETFASLVRGEISMQRAHGTGVLQLSGEPECLLRMAFLFDGASALAARGGSHAGISA